MKGEVEKYSYLLLRLFLSLYLVAGLKWGEYLERYNTCSWFCVLRVFVGGSACAHDLQKGPLPVQSYYAFQFAFTLDTRVSKIYIDQNIT